VPTAVAAACALATACDSSAEIDPASASCFFSPGAGAKCCSMDAPAGFVFCFVEVVVPGYLDEVRCVRL
jgi:hypothetical protein